ncbi:MAG: SET domain-containing protein, partial [Oligoflexus sp.]|nr:SET domain-containing protein [Oligoflexus sp.]
MTNVTHKSVDLPPGLLVVNKNQELGVYATQSFLTGDRVVTFEAIFVEKATKYTIQVDERRHLLTEGNIGAFLNHSCYPNARFMAETWEMVTVKPIKIDEEVTFNYLSSEWEMASPF